MMCSLKIQLILLDNELFFDYLVIWESAILTSVSYIGNDRRKSSKKIF